MSRHTYNYRDWYKELQAGKIRPLYLISGEEHFLIEHALQLMQNMIIEPASATLDFVKIKENYTEEQLLAEIQTVPFMSAKRLVLVYESGLFNKQKGDSAEKYKFLQRLIAALNETVCLCFIESKIDKRQKKNLALLQEANGVWIIVDQESESQLKSWMSGILAKYNLRITREAGESLLLRCEHSMQQLYWELDKLAKYCQYTGRSVIDYELLELCCREDIAGNIFKLTDAVSAKDTALALSLLDKLLKQQEAEILILFMLARHFRQLLCAKDAKSADELGTKLKLHPFVAKKAFAQAKQLQREDLLRLCLACYESEKGIKSGRIEARTALELLLLKPLAT